MFHLREKILSRRFSQLFRKKSSSHNDNAAAVWTAAAVVLSQIFHTIYH